MALQNQNFPVSFFSREGRLALVSRLAKRTWWSDTAWTPAMEAHADDLVERAPDGSLRFVTSDSVTTEFLAGLRKIR
jgi:hypothetical protein